MPSLPPPAVANTDQVELTQDRRGSPSASYGRDCAASFFAAAAGEFMPRTVWPICGAP